MVAARPIEQNAEVEREQRLVIPSLTFKDYVILGDVLGHRPGMRLTFLEGTLEIMVTSRRHGQLKKVIARLVEIYALARGVRITGFGSATFRREEAERGLEPDECYCVDGVKEFPDLAIEVVVSHPLVNKLKVYEGLGVREVWVHEQGVFSLYRLAGAGYENVERSEFFPDLDFTELATFAKMSDQDEAVRAYFRHLGGQIG
jgi:Uma2 family endonuclease